MAMFFRGFLTEQPVRKKAPKIAVHFDPSPGSAIDVCPANQGKTKMTAKFKAFTIQAGFVTIFGFFFLLYSFQIFH